MILRERPVDVQEDEQRQDRPLVTTDNLLVGGLRAPERLSDQPRLNYGFEIDLDRPSLATPAYLRLRKEAMSRCTSWSPEFRHPLPKPWCGEPASTVFPSRIVRDAAVASEFPSSSVECGLLDSGTFAS